MKNGQSSLEFLVVLGLFLVALIPILMYATSSTNKDMKVAQMDTTLQNLQAAINTVHALGPGTTEVVTILVPQGVENITFSGNEIQMVTFLFGGRNDFHKSVNPQVSGSLPNLTGVYQVRVFALENGSVEVTLN